MSLIPISGFSDPVSSLSHLISAPVVLYFGIIIFKRLQGNLNRSVSLSIFIFSATLLLSMSGTFHLLSPGTSARYVLQILDHAAIFILIAATFTPIHTLQFKGFMRWGILLLVWSVAIVSITLKSIYFDEVPEILSLSLYLGVGWLGALTGFMLYRRFSLNTILPLLYGAMAYSIGATMEFLRIPIVIPGVIGPHELFHILVLFGIGFHLQFVHRMACLHKAEQLTH